MRVHPRPPRGCSCLASGSTGGRPPRGGTRYRVVYRPGGREAKKRYGGIFQHQTRGEPPRRLDRGRTRRVPRP